MQAVESRQAIVMRPAREASTPGRAVLQCRPPSDPLVVVAAGGSVSPTRPTAGGRSAACRRSSTRYGAVALHHRLATAVAAGGVVPAHAAAFDGASLSLAWIIPFVGLLSSIALLPLVASHLWHRHFGKISAAWALAFVVPFALTFGIAETGHQLAHAALLEYLPFVVLLFALYTVSGGISVLGDLRGTPNTNLVLLALGTVLANLMGTTGAAMLLVRPLIRANADRTHNVHVLVFFIFLVANAGGSLTPLGDPPLFLGFLNGVSFFWTTGALLAPALTLWSALLAVFYAADRFLYAKFETSRSAHAVTPPPRPNAGAPVRLDGKINLLLLVGVVVAVLMSGFWRPGIAYRVLDTPVALQDLVRDALLVGIALLSLAITSPAIHRANAFHWGPMQEVAKLFAAIFVTIVPAIAILKAGEAGGMAFVTRLVTTARGAPSDPMYFWLTGLLSAFLDNAPTYLVFFNLAGADAGQLMAQRKTLEAISAGAVFMGAFTYIGNAPNFMVRSIAEDQGIRMPSFFGYMAWSVPILTPLFALLTWLYFF